MFRHDVIFSCKWALTVAYSWFCEVGKFFDQASFRIIHLVKNMLGKFWKLVILNFDGG